MDDIKVRIKHNFFSAGAVFKEGSLAQRKDEERTSFPAITLDCSYQFTFELWQDLDKNILFSAASAATIKLWMRPKGSLIDWVEVGTCSAPTSPVNIFTITVHRDLIPSSTWGVYDQIEIALEIVYDTDHGVLLSQEVELINPKPVMDADGIDLATLPISVTTLVGNTTITAANGWRIFLLDTTAGAFQVNLPSPVGNQGARIELVYVRGAAAVTINPDIYQINASADDVVLNTLWQALDLHATNLTSPTLDFWMNANRSIGV